MKSPNWSQRQLRQNRCIKTGSFPRPVSKVIKFFFISTTWSSLSLLRSATRATKSLYEIAPLELICNSNYCLYITDSELQNRWTERRRLHAGHRATCLMVPEVWMDKKNLIRSWNENIKMNGFSSHLSLSALWNLDISTNFIKIRFHLLMFHFILDVC